MLTAALDQAYRDITPERRFPILALRIEIDPARVDSNVSPTKSEVKFQNEGQAFDALRVSIKSALMEHGMMPSVAGVAAANEALEAAFRSSVGATFSLSELSVSAQAPLNDLATPLPETGLTPQFLPT